MKFLFRVTVRRHDLVAEIFSLKEPVKVPLVLSRNEVKRILLMAPSLKARVMLSLAYGCGMAPLRKIDWVVYAKEPFARPKAVLAYLSRYTHRIAISNSRLIRFDAHSVTFRVKDYRLNGARRHTTMTLATGEFIRRFLIHVLPKGQHRIRHYGFYGNGNRAANISRIRDLFGAEPPTWKEVGDKDEGDNDPCLRCLALPCPCCGGRLIIKGTFKPTQQTKAPPRSTRHAA